MIELRPYKASDAIEIMQGQANQPGLVLDSETMQFALACELGGLALTAVCDGRIIACGGLRPIWTGVVEAWVLPVADIANYGAFFAKAVKKTLREWQKQYKFRRIQAPLRASFGIGERFAKFVGFEFEGLLRKFHYDGEDALMYAIVGEE